MRKYIFSILGLIFIFGSANAIVQCVPDTGWVTHNATAGNYRSDWSASGAASGPNGGMISYEGYVHGIATCAGSASAGNNTTVGVYSIERLGFDVTQFYTCLCRMIYPAVSPWIQARVYPTTQECWQYCADYCVQSDTVAAVAAANMGI